jgi:FkbM family methyltransferase
MSASVAPGQQRVQLPPLTRAQGRGAIFEYLLAHQELANADLSAADCAELQFLAFCVEHFPFSKAQLFQDLYVLFKLAKKKAGYFVEFGATDGISLSNTYQLENKYAWQGLLAEPYPFWHSSLSANRRATIDHRCVWKDTGSLLTFVASTMPEFAGLRQRARCDHHADARLSGAREIQVETISLLDLLTFHKAPAIVDYLSVDTEGSEFDILSAFDFQQYKIRLITVEHNYVEKTRGDIYRVLTSHGYRRELEMFSKWDDWYYHPDFV